jgi:hypothetical protein
MVTDRGPQAEWETSAGSSAVSAPFAEVRQEAEPGAVRPLSGARSPDRGREGTGAARQPEQTYRPNGYEGAGSATASSALVTAFAEVSQEAEQGAVRSLLGARSPDPALSGTGFSYRHNWGPRRGAWTLRLNWGSVTPRSRVLVSIAEGAAGGPDNGKFIGAARYTLHNVAPRAGGVDIWVNIEWSSDILLYVDYLVVNP